MPAMSPFEAAFCRSAPWRLVARRVVLPWALQGGRLIGHDLLASRPFQLLHKAEGAGHQMIRRGQLEPVLHSLPLDDAHVRVGRGGFVARFRATAVEGSATLPVESTAERTDVS